MVNDNYMNLKKKKKFSQMHMESLHHTNPEYPKGNFYAENTISLRFVHNKSRPLECL